MVPKIRRGSRTHGLLAYLYGPGKRDEHIDPHLVGSWDGFAPDPGRDPEATLARLAAALDLRVKQAGPKAPTEHVWHCSVRTAPDDRLLTDAEWHTAARRLVQAVGLAPEGDPDGCRWVAVRHADDHIHIVAIMVRGDLRRPRLNYDKKKAQAECRLMEREMGLRQLKPGDGTAAKAPTSAERFKAERLGRPQTPRETLRENVRQALAGAATEEEFFTRLRDAGVRVQLRHAPSGDVLGYKVALPGDRNRDREPVWFAGSTLAPDLSLPKIRKRITAERAVSTETASSIASVAPSTRWSAPAKGRRHATDVAEHAATSLTTDGDEAASQLVGVGELLDALAQTSPAATRQELRAATQAFERATRSHTRAQRADARALRSAARGIIQAGSALGRGEDGGATAMLLSTLVLVTVAAARWHSARHHAQQAEAARQAAGHLRAAYRQAATTPMQTLRDQGRALPEVERRRHEATISAALHHRTSSVEDESGHAKNDALAATLAQVEEAGHDPETLLQQAIAMRELDTAESANDVLVWRLRRLANLPAHPQPVSRRPRTETGTNSASCRTTQPAMPEPRSAAPDFRSRPARR
ncbi:relaxase/mobilization nuclease domain-containing protein [Streptantibioticus ferralitis]|uniref:Relaxase/mobilization nuclease domain-containing protein n=1 Tax=Streptantibioticus ferralitis TaxID=236510 RepID=A0ABT5YS96_9ACTN|nr:relaxase/mobilization nuclease domain-containing protein [Streptantibioticus ferralitis]MDF2254368.1 relaxase/mobilization nuclease domain-containing protein [Streptantibioticus ferralitis]